jgi:hypothetical protein
MNNSINGNDNPGSRGGGGGVLVAVHRNNGNGDNSQNTSKRGMPPPGFRCNKCAKPLVKNCFVCACDCVFCESTYIAYCWPAGKANGQSLHQQDDDGGRQ